MEFTLDEALLETIVLFFVGWLISTIIIFLVTKISGEHEGIGVALIAALIGAAIYGVSYHFLGGWIAAIIAGIVWLFAIMALYKMKFGKALVTAVLIWIIAFVFSYFLIPTLIGPL